MTAESDEQVVLRKLLRLLDASVTEWSRVVGAPPPGSWEVQDGSPLAGDARKSTKYQVGHRAWLALTVAVDFLACLQDSLRGEQHDGTMSVNLHKYGQFALIRGALEAGGLAVWLLGPPSRTTRIANCLGLAWKEIKPTYALLEFVGATPPRPEAEQRRQLIETLIAAGWTKPATTKQSSEKAVARLFEKCTYSAIMKAAGELSGRGGDMVHAVWSACSGLAHGDVAKTLGILNLSDHTRVSPHETAIRVGANVDLLHRFSRVAVEMTDHGFELYRQRATAP